MLYTRMLNAFGDEFKLCIINPMRVKVRFFAALKDITGQSEIQLEVGEEAITPRSVFYELKSRYPELDRYTRVVLVAVNHEYADWETRIGAGDEIVFFPPVSGGAL